MEILILGLIAFIIGISLNFIANKFKIEESEDVESVLGILPMANCGGCGYPNCEAYAKAIVNDKEEINKCSVGGVEVLTSLGKYLNIQTEYKDAVKYAIVGCNGKKAKEKYEYEGIKTCASESMIQGQGHLVCTYGCLGHGDCKVSCEFGAIKIEEGVAVINKDKCVACGKCIETCPKQLIKMIDSNTKIKLLCNNEKKGREVKLACQDGCIGCMICKKVCEFGAVTFENNLPIFDNDKCTYCKKCIEKCPSKCLI